MTAFDFRALASIAALALAACGLQGCNGGQRLGQIPPGFAKDHEAGIAVIGDDYHLHADTTIKSDKPVLFTLKSNEPHAYRGKTTYADFRAYVKPDTSQGLTGDVKVNFTDPIVEIITGWAYLIGTSPTGKTTRVRAVGEGTKIIIEVDRSGMDEIHRVYFVGDAGSQVDIYVPSNLAPPSTPTFTMKTPGTYVEVMASDRWTDMGAYSTNRARAAFVAMVLGETGKVGVK